MNIKIPATPAERYKALKAENDTLKDVNTVLSEYLKAIRDMPDYDQDDKHRMRHLAKKALEKSND